MKRVNVITLISILLTFGFSQFPAGTMGINGSFSWSKISYEHESYDESVTMIVADPAFSFFPAANLSIDLMLEYMKMETDEYSSDNTGFGAGATFYMNKAYIGVGYVDASSDGDNDAFIVGDAGFLHPLTDSVYLDFGVGYYAGQGDNYQDMLTIGAGIRIFLKK